MRIMVKDTVRIIKIKNDFEAYKENNDFALWYLFKRSKNEIH